MFPGLETQYQHIMAAASTMCNLWEMEPGEPDLDRMFRRLKDLSAYSLTHAEIMDQREGVELFALAMFFGATSDPRYHDNQKRLMHGLSSETYGYEGCAETIEQEVKARGKRR